MESHSRRPLLRDGLVVLLVGVSLALGASVARADRNELRFAVHCKPVLANASVPACGTPEIPSELNSMPCSNYATEAPLGPSLVYVVVARAGSEGIIGASFGVEYEGGIGEGIDSRFVHWSGCSDGLEFPNAGPQGEFPASKGGLRITWATCQLQEIPPEGVHVVVGTFYVYAYSDAVLSLIPNNNLESGPEIDVADCGGVESDLLTFWAGQSLSYLMGSAGFGTRFGVNVCSVIPAGTPTTWGRVKTLYSSSGP